MTDQSCYNCYFHGRMLRGCGNPIFGLIPLEDRTPKGAWVPLETGCDLWRQSEFTIKGEEE